MAQGNEDRTTYQTSISKIYQGRSDKRGAGMAAYGEIMNDIETIKELYRTYWKDMIAKNADGLRSIMSEDYYLLHMTGVKQSAEVFLKGLLDGTFNYYSAEHDEIVVHVDGNKASMIGKSRVVAAVYGGGKNSWRLQGDFSLRKEDGDWKLTSSRASTY